MLRASGNRVGGSGAAATPLAAAPRARRRGAAAAAAAAAAPAVVPAAQQAVDPRFPVIDHREQCRELRAKLCQETLAGGLIYVSGGDLAHRNGADVYHKFRPSSDFAYLTGVCEPGFGALIDPESQRFVLVAPKVPAEAAVWWGGLPSADALAEAAGADECIYAEDLPAYVKARHGGVETLHVREQDHPDAMAAALALPGARGHQASQAQQLAGLQGAAAAGAVPSAAFLGAALARARATKTAAEVGCLLAASAGSGAGHAAMWAAAAPGVTEFQLEAAFVHAAALRGLTALGYPCIVGAGRNAAVLHYERNAATLAEGDLVLVDAGAEFRCYTADISRTFPASGTFKAPQRDVYDLVLALQEGALRRMRPGVPWADVQAAARAELVDGLAALGLVRGSTEELLEQGIDRVFMPHGLGHHLGLDVHDVSPDGPVPAGRLEAGHVLTVEPGVYFMPLLLERAFADPAQARCLNRAALEGLVPLGGVRIEDNVLLTSDEGGGGGVFNITLAAGVPKRAEEIEALMAAAR
ncbi:hypothetical protein HT031_006578 [Scenedesmus sp. PABB004]|nr:hypothetical protein HT031_006578 [Scenedesmus sp. PABB004]